MELGLLLLDVTVVSLEPKVSLGDPDALSYFEVDNDAFRCCGQPARVIGLDSFSK